MSGVRTIAVTGANGFIGKRLCERLRAEARFEVLALVRATDAATFNATIARADVVAHMAGVTRPKEIREFDEGNRQLTQALAAAIARGGRRPLILFASTVRAREDTEYGRTKRAAEEVLLRLGEQMGAVIAVFRLGQVFGRGARPYYNAISATLLADAAQGRKTSLNRPDDPIELVDVAAVIDALVQAIEHPSGSSGIVYIPGSHHTTVGSVAEIAARFGAGDPPRPGQPLEAALFRAFEGYVGDFSAAGSPRTP